MIQQLLSLINGKVTRIGVGVDSFNEHEDFESETSESTTSDVYITKTGFPWTTATKTAGRYKISYYAEIDNSQKQKTMGCRVSYQLNGAGGYTIIGLNTDGSAENGGILAFSGFKEINLAVDSTIDILVEYGLTTGGGTMTISRVRISVEKVEE